jgi:predicted DCC family thiol-disulfide oxidoreductase YuxK
MSDNPDMTRPVVFYDGGCPLCRREIAHYLRIDHEQRIEWVDIDHDENVLHDYGLTRDQAMRRMHVRDASGVMVSGVDAFAVLWRQLPRYRWLASIVTLPGIHWFGEQVYRVFARSRYRSRCSDVACSADLPKQ